MNQPFKYFKDKKEIWADFERPKSTDSNEVWRAFADRPHFTVSPEPDWEDGKIVEEGVHFIFEDSCDKIRCHCPCHKNPGIIHIAACCKNGWIEMNKKTIAIPLPKECCSICGSELVGGNCKRCTEKLCKPFPEQQDIPMDKEKADKVAEFISEYEKKDFPKDGSYKKYQAEFEKFLIRLYDKYFVSQSPKEEKE